LTGMPPATSTRVTAGTREFSRPDYVVLGMVRLGARSGYEIKQAVELSIRFFWTISQAQIYPSLERLEAAGLVEGCSEPLGKRQRRTFEITEAGETALREWLQRDEPMPFELRDVGMVKLFFADALNGDEALSLVNSLKQRSEERVATLRSIEPIAKRSAEEGNTLPGLTLRMGIAFHQAMIDVCEKFEREAADSLRR
jgi:PadR family transcriptional regulator, regulatory protein AphA